jgi:hypothetical protein
MTQSTVLAVGDTAAISTDIIVAAGSAVTVGIFSVVASHMPGGIAFSISMKTPGADTVVATLDGSRRQVVLAGPGTFRVRRPDYTGTAFGVFIET